MTDPSPSEFVAAHELGRYPPEAVLRLIEAVRRWRDTKPHDLHPAVWFDETVELAAAIDALLGREP